MFSQTIKTALTYSVILPSKKTEKKPVLILLHGYGSNETDLYDMARSMNAGFTTFSLRAPNTTRDGGYCWYELEVLPNQQFKYDYQQAKKSREAILSFISNACKVYHLDSTQVFLLGFSQGTIMSYDLAFSSPSKIKGVVALSGRIMDESKASITSPIQLAKVKFFIAHGNSDNVIKREEADKAEAFLKDKKVTDLTYKLYEIPHSINGTELNDLRSWLSKAITPATKQPSIKK